MKSESVLKWWVFCYFSTILIHSHTNKHFSDSILNHSCVRTQSESTNIHISIFILCLCPCVNAFSFFLSLSVSLLRVCVCIFFGASLCHILILRYSTLAVVYLFGLSNSFDLYFFSVFMKTCAHVRIYGMYILLFGRRKIWHQFIRQINVDGILGYMCMFSGLPSSLSSLVCVLACECQTLVGSSHKQMNEFKYFTLFFSSSQHWLVGRSVGRSWKKKPWPVTIII